MSEFVWPDEPQHARCPCPLPTSGVYSNSCPLSRWCHPNISSPVVPFSSFPQSFPASGSFQLSQLFASVQFSRSVMSNSLWSHESHHARPPCCVHHQLPEFTQTQVHQVGDAIQPSHSLSSTSPPAPNPSQHQSFPMSQLFAWGGQSIGVSALASVLPKNTQDWSPLEWTGWISLQSKG